MDHLKMHAVAIKGRPWLLGATHQKDQVSSDEEESDTGDEDEDSDEKEETDKEDVEEDAAVYCDQVPENEGQSTESSSESKERNQVTTENIKKEVATPEEEITQQEGENAEVCAMNNSSEAIKDANDDSTSGRLLGKKKTFSFFKRKSSKQKNVHSCDESSLEKLPQSEQETGNQAGLPHKSSQDENQNHTEENQKETSSTNGARKTSSTCVVL